MESKLIKSKYPTSKKLLSVLQWGVSELNIPDPLTVGIKLATLKWLHGSVEWKLGDPKIKCREIATYSDQTMTKGILDDKVSTSFIINLWYKLDHPEQCSAIFHELVHIKQQKEKQITKALTEGKVMILWNGHTFPGGYLDSPWEKEAFKLEKQMIKKYGQIQRNKRKN